MNKPLPKTATAAAPKSAATSRANPLGLAVLVLLFERSMHPYEMGAMLRDRGKEKSIKFRYGSLYTVIDRLAKDGLIREAGAERDGRRPERTVYDLTDAGRAEMEAWLAELVGEPAKEYPAFEAALSLLPGLPPARAIELLAARRDRLDAMVAEHKAEIAGAEEMGVPRLFLIESLYEIALHEAERAFTDGLVRMLKKTKLPGIELWQAVHAPGRKPGSGLPIDPPWSKS